MPRSRSLFASLAAPALGLALLLGAAACAKGSGPTTVPTDGAGAPEAGTAAEPATVEPTDAEAANAEPADAELAGQPVVKNLDAQPGDVTTCPFSGRTFVVKAEHPTVEYQGKRYWICSEKAAEQVRADPAKYLDGFEG